MKVTVAQPVKSLLVPGDIVVCHGKLYVVLEEEIGKTLLRAHWGAALMRGCTPIVGLADGIIYQDDLSRSSWKKCKAINNGQIFEEKGN